MQPQEYQPRKAKSLEMLKQGLEQITLKTEIRALARKAKECLTTQEREKNYTIIEQEARKIKQIAALINRT